MKVKHLHSLHLSNRNSTLFRPNVVSFWRTVPLYVHVETKVEACGAATHKHTLSFCFEDPVRYDSEKERRPDGNRAERIHLSSSVSLFTVVQHNSVCVCVSHEGLSTNQVLFNSGVLFPCWTEAVVKLHSLPVMCVWNMNTCEEFIFHCVPNRVIIQ